MEKLGVFGGSFNPIHKGHTGLALAAARFAGLNKVLLLPCAKPPHKPAPSLLSGEHRLAMCRLACAGHSLLAADNQELSMPPPSYTYNTLQVLHSRFPQSRLYLIIGADMLLSFEQWRNWREIGKLAVVLAGAREKGKEQAQALTQKVKWLARQGVTAQIFPLEVLELSSTEIRKRLAQGQDVSHMLEPAVQQYIYTHGLYR